MSTTPFIAEAGIKSAEYVANGRDAVGVSSVALFVLVLFEEEDDAEVLAFEVEG